MTDYQCEYFNLSGGTPAVCRKLRRVSGIAVATCVNVIGSRLSTGETGGVSLDALVTVSGIVGTNTFPGIFISSLWSVTMPRTQLIDMTALSMTIIELHDI